jgi:hypothetical protein
MILWKATSDKPSNILIVGFCILLRVYSIESNKPPYYVAYGGLFDSIEAI